MALLSRQQITAALLTAALCAFPALTRADNDADRIPADAVAYVHWSGEDAIGDAFAKSHTKGLIDALKLQQFLVDEMNKHVSKLPDAKDKDRAQVVHDFLQTALHYPASLYVGSVDLSNPDKPKPTIALFFKLGAAKAGEFAEKLNAAKPADDQQNITISAPGEYLLVNIGGDADMTRRLATVPPTDGLGSTEAFNKTIAQFGPGAAESPALVYINGESALHIVDDLVAAKGGQGGRIWSAAETSLGLTELKEFAWAGNLDGQDWSGQLFIGMGQNRTGLLDFLDNKPLPEDTLKLIPANATWAGVFPFDAARFLNDIRTAAGQIDPRGQQNFDFALRQFFAFTGVDLKDGLIASAGDEFAYYAFPDANGKSLPNVVFVSRLKNPQKMESSLSTLENTIGAMIMQRDTTGTVSFKTEPLDAPDDKITAHLLVFPEASPCWAIKDDILYVGISKAAVQHAMDNANTGPITDNATFAALKTKIAVDQISGFDFLDLPKLAPEEYDVVQKLLAAQKAPYSLPPLNHITPNLSPDLTVSWTDTAGFHAKSIGPFPLAANLLSPYQVTVRKIMTDAVDRRLKEQASPTTQEKLP